MIRDKPNKVVDSYIELKKLPNTMKEINWGDINSIKNWEKNNPKDFKRFNEANLSYKEVVKRYGKELTDKLYVYLKSRGKLWGTYKPDATEQEQKEGHFFNDTDIKDVIKNVNSI